MSENLGIKEFTEVYTKLLVAVWTDEKVAQRLREDPHAVAADVGLMIPADVKITVTEATGETAEDPQAELASYHADFQKGIENKVVELVIPQAPALNVSELSSDELAEVAGGAVVCCCCCPCCCCNG